MFGLTLATWSTSCVWRRRFFPGSKKSQMLFCEDRTATPLPTHSEQSTSKTFGSLPCFSNKEMMTLMCSSCEDIEVHRDCRISNILSYVELVITLTLIMFKASGESIRTQWSTSNIPVPSLEACDPSRLNNQFKRLLLANCAQFVWFPLIIAANSWYRYPDIWSQAWPLSSPESATRKPCDVITLILSMASSIKFNIPSSWNRSWRFLRARNLFCFSSCST